MRIGTLFELGMRRRLLPGTYEKPRGSKFVRSTAGSGLRPVLRTTTVKSVTSPSSSS